MKIYDNELGKEIDISDSDLPNFAGDTRYSLPNKKFEFEDKYGVRGQVDAKDINRAIVDGLNLLIVTPFWFGCPQ